MKTECNYLEKQGFEGIDINLSISLFEYGLIWKQFKYNTKKRGRRGEYLFLYGTKENDKGYYTDYDYAYIKPCDIKKEFDWVDFKAVNSFLGQDIMELDFPYQIKALFDYYGRMEIFGAYS